MGERGDLGKYLGNLNFKQVPTCDFVGGGPQSCYPVIDIEFYLLKTGLDMIFLKQQWF